MPKESGFTLIELLVVITIVTILSVVGLVAFQNVRAKALESQRIASIDAIKKAYEVKYDPAANGGQGGYKPVVDSDFASGKIPTPDGTTGTSYVVSTANPDGSLANFTACVNKDNGSICYAQSTACYCKTSNQGTPVTLRQNNATSCDPSGNLLNGLVGYWKFDEGSGTTTADWTKNGTDANLISGPAWSSTVNKPSFGKSISFDGSDDVVQAPANSLLNSIGTGAFTFSLWVYPTATMNWTGLLLKGSAWLINGGLGCLRYGGITGTACYINAPVPVNAWTNLVVTYDPAGGSTSQNAYTQGVYRGSLATTGSIGVNTTPLQIGGPGGNTMFKGLIDDVRVYNRALSAAEIKTLYNNGDGCLP